MEISSKLLQTFPLASLKALRWPFYCTSMQQTIPRLSALTADLFQTVFMGT